MTDRTRNRPQAPPQSSIRMIGRKVKDAALRMKKTKFRKDKTALGQSMPSPPHLSACAFSYPPPTPARTCPRPGTIPSVLSCMHDNPPHETVHPP